MRGEKRARRGALQGLAPALALLARRYWWRGAAWAVPLWGLVAATAPSYRDTYPSLASRSSLIEAMRATPGTRLLYGILPRPGRLGQLLAWETGTYLLVCTALMAILLTCQMMRGDEERGLAELARATGCGGAVPFLAPWMAVWGAVALLGGGVGAILMAEAGSIDELTARGGWAMAACAIGVGWAFSAGAALACQAARGHRQARSLSLAWLGGCFGLRVAADEWGWAWLRWVTPLGWRDLVQPYTQDDGTVVAFLLIMCLALMMAAVGLHARREHLGGFLPSTESTERRWALRGPLALAWCLGRRGLGGWAVAVACASALFGSMAGGITDLLRPGSPTAALVERMSTGSPVEQFLGLLTVIVVLLVSVGSIHEALRLPGSEHAGILELEASVGAGRSRLFLVQAAVAAGHAAILLLVSAGVLAAVVSTRITEERAVGRALWFTLSQGPGVLAGIGIAMALAGLSARLAPWVWAVVAWSGFAQFFGGLVDLPGWARDLSILGHHLDVVGDVEWEPLAIQAALATGGMLVGLLAVRRRDL